MCPALQTELKPELLTDPYDSFMQRHLQYYGYYKENKAKEEEMLLRPAWRNRRKEQTPTDSDSDRFSHDQKKLIYSLLLESTVFKSRQIVFDNQEGQIIPRLREPRDLFSTFKKNGLLHPPRWPTECEVIPGEITHIEWDPPHPEPFYRHSGKEAMPLVSMEGDGKVVYEIRTACKGSCFTGSRTGGRRCVNPIPRTYVDGKNNDLQFESRFESGNLQKAVKVGTYEYELTLRTDLYTSKHTQWFYFQVKNTKKGVPYRFTITNLMKSNSLYNAGMKPLMYSENNAALAGDGWKREGRDIKYYRNSCPQDRGSLYCLTWTFEFPHDNDTCYFAHCYPYTYSDLHRDIQRWTSDPECSQYCKLRALCRSLAGNTVYLMTITSPSVNPELATTKKAVVVTARVHPGETNGSWMMKGFLDFILSDSPDAQLLRDTFIFKVVPMLNPDGVIVGNYRCSLSGRDLNRNYRSMLKDSFPCIWHTRAMIKRLVVEREVLLYCDFHGHSRKSNVFMYGCNNKGQPESRLHERIFPLMLSKNAPDKFFFKGCKFKVQKSKEGTGRIVMWRHGIRNSYTMESTFGGSTLGDRKGTHFTANDLKSMGHHFCDTLLDYCDPDNTKFQVCLSELETIVQDEIKEKLKQLGRGVDSDVNLSDISLSDIESSTSGSNSSESDGLPAHLLNLAEKLFRKKKRLRSRKERNSMYQRRSSKYKPKSQSSVANVTESSNQTAKSTVSKSSSKGDTEKRKRKQMKLHDSSSSQTDMAQTAAAPPAVEKPTLSYVRKPESVSMKTQLINRLPASYIGDFSAVDHVCPRHGTIKTRETVNGNRLPLIVTVIQRSSLPPFPKDASPIKQHPPPFHAMLDFSNDKSHVTDHVLKRADKPILSRGLASSVGTKPYSFATIVDKRKSPETSSSTIDLQLGLSPQTLRTNRTHLEPLITLVTSELLDNILPKPKRRISDSMKPLPNLRRSESLISAQAEGQTHLKQSPV